MSAPMVPEGLKSVLWYMAARDKQRKFNEEAKKTQNETTVIRFVTHDDQDYSNLKARAKEVTARVIADMKLPVKEAKEDAITLDVSPVSLAGLWLFSPGFLTKLDKALEKEFGYDRKERLVEAIHPDARQGDLDPKISRGTDVAVIVGSSAHRLEL